MAVSGTILDSVTRSEGGEMVEMHAMFWQAQVKLDFTEKDGNPLEGFEKRNDLIYIILTALRQSIIGDQPGRPLRMLLQ